MDDDNYVFILAAIAKELKARGLSGAKIHLAVGLPLKWVQAQRDSFREYMIQNRHDYVFHNPCCFKVMTAWNVNVSEL